MHVLVLGAGLVGITSAWYLRRAGHEVTVVDRQPGAGLETSFANGGQISVSHPEPWSNPSAPLQILRWLGREDAPLLFRPRADGAQWAWGLRFLIECLPARCRRNTLAIAHLALYSRGQLQRLLAETGIAHDRLCRGILHLFFSRREFARAPARARLLRELGMRAEVLDANACRELEPALADSRATLHGGLYAPEDESGDAFAFTRQLASHCQREGVRFHYGTQLTALAARGRRIVAAEGRGPDGAALRLGADAFLAALGSHTPALLRPLGLRLPVYPVKGYSVTLPLAAGSAAPFVSLTDESHRIVCSRLGNRLRIAGMAELSGYDVTVNATRCAAILRRARELLPRLEPAGAPEYWAGLRPATPGNVPLIGRSGFDNLFLNTGHGTLGWTLACGSGRAIADIVSGRPPEVDFPFRHL